ncbi:uncharacterized protein PHACADRAFT_33042 [Phanerochaete carnosa HHB-10118-sp]|uniref:Uncharacterized protein n=1 Tax=Phanerochaete carnosa (strain HHB-10118-sp) TaxID=650164 RepID=K5VTY0_PHACS|nr:uncharacterized protein PHACADRAFT_33042 [Phanerochaete carnosa HHB-10118-sp]EKM50250.1 hypothetical protein PHACADRAFT_33042 [Phanerochaete carnosa HHB-10118-sp]
MAAVLYFELKRGRMRADELPIMVHSYEHAGYDMNDVFVPRLTKPGFYKIFGRTDNQITRSTGEKTDPDLLKAVLNQGSHIKCAVVFGRGKFNMGVVINPAPEFVFNPADKEKLNEF